MCRALKYEREKGKAGKEFGKTAFRKFSDKQNTYTKMLIIKEFYIFQFLIDYSYKEEREIKSLYA